MGTEKFKDYKLISELGRGGTGVVFLARHKQSGQKVALKVVHEHLLPSESGDQKAQFVRDVMLNCRLDHPNIVQMQNAFVERGKLVTVCELLDGDTMDAILASPVVWPVELRLDWLLQVLNGVSFAHQAGIVHGDLKPSNIFVTKANQVKILDWGLNRELTPDTRSVDADQIPGTPAYLAPETYCLNNTVSVRDAGKLGDVFTTGVVAYRMLNGCLPFGLIETMSATEIYTRLAVNYNAGEPIPRMNTGRNGIPVEVADAVMECLALVPQKRPATIEWLAAVVLNVRREPLPARSLGGLVSYFKSMPPKQKTSGPISSFPPVVHGTDGVNSEFARPKRRRRRLFRFVLGALFLLCGVAAGLVYVRPDLIDRFSAWQGCEKDTGAICKLLEVLPNDGLAIGRGQDGYVDACEGNIGGACWILGDQFAHGKSGVQPDAEKAAAYFEKSCELGHTAGCGSLGELMLLGKGGLLYDEKRALQLFRKSCNDGYIPACVHLGNMHKQGQGGLSPSDDHALALYTRTCDASDMNGCVQLARMHELGEGGLVQNYKTAGTLYEMACQKGTAAGCMRLGEMYMQGAGLDRDLTKARTFKKKACDLGLKEACITGSE